MKFIVISFILMSIVSVTLGSLYQSITADPENPDNCLVEGKSFTPGTHTNPSSTECKRVECHKGGHAEVADCGVTMHGNPNCKNDGLLDVSLPYPECCAIKWLCTEN